MSGKELALALARDRKFRRQLVSAAGHATTARRRAAGRLGLMAAAARLAADEELRRELAAAARDLQDAWSRVDKKRSHRLRNTMLVAAGGAAAFTAYKRRSKIPVRGVSAGISTIDESIEVEVPVPTAYNQWTQFEDFPVFMEGVDHVEQRDDTRLHWVATVAGRTAEWDARILEQHPDRQISWISEDGRKTRGTVSFEPLGESRTLIRLSMSYKAEGPLERAGSAVGLDAGRVRGDLQRFKELIEGRGEESGAWRGEVSAAESQS
ncbi:MAG TPA: SRPBCC family protein [Solirubrobacteraceae bacterium]|nr:SRPBCC family protein [Solirubrobacteraceae bacterium]